MVKRSFLSDFTESKIELVGHVLIIDGKRYINRGLWLIDSIDLKERLVFKDDMGSETWFAETLPFSQVDLIPLFATIENTNGQRAKDG